MICKVVCNVHILHHKHHCHTHYTTSYIVPQLSCASAAYCIMLCCFLTLVSPGLKATHCHTFLHLHSNTHTHMRARSLKTPLLPWHSRPKCCGHTGVSLAQHMEGKCECVLTNQSPIPPRERKRCEGLGLKDFTTCMAGVER